MTAAWVGRRNLRSLVVLAPVRVRTPGTESPLGSR